MNDLTVAEIKQKIIDDMETIARELAPGGDRLGSMYCARNPTRADRSPGSFLIHVRGQRAGAWNDYATGDKGDAIDFIAYCCGYCASTPPSREARIEAIQWAKARLGLANITPAERSKIRDDLEKAKTRKLASEERERRERERRAFELWMKGLPIEDTPVEEYLRFRGIEWRSIANPEPSLRYLASLSHFEESHVGPAMLAAFKSAGGAIVGVHCTWLKLDGAGKADVGKPKMMYGTVKGAAIRLTKGPSGLSCEEAAKQAVAGTLAISEGIENGLTVAMAAPELRIHAAGSIANIGNQPALGCVAANIILADNDMKPQARAALEKAAHALGTQSVPLTIARAVGGVKDFNELV